MKKKNPTLEELRARARSAGLPRHVAIIMDGNGRWATRRGLPRIMGHRKGVETVRRVTELCRELGIPVLTLYAFSDENWGRPRDEVSFLMDMLEKFLRSEIETMKKNNIRFRTIGRIDRLPAPVQEQIARGASETAPNTGMVLNLALSYGGRGEILEAVKKLTRSSAGGVEGVTEEGFSSVLDTAGLPDPDLLIRTSGEKRISNFLLWQAAYAELYFTDTLWPDFGEKDLLLAIVDFQGRERRFGLTGAQVGAGKGHHGESERLAPSLKE